MHDWKAELIRRIGDRSVVREDALEEVALHLEQRYRALLARGCTEQQARTETLGELSDSTGLGATLRSPARFLSSGSSMFERRGDWARRHPFAVPERLLRDARFALRLLRCNPLFTVVAMATLALGIAATTAIFSVVYGLFFAPLPYKQPDRLVMVWAYVYGYRAGASPKSYTAWKRQATVFADLNAWAGST